MQLNTMIALTTKIEPSAKHARPCPHRSQESFRQLENLAAR